jgi:hypothetical protein
VNRATEKTTGLRQTKGRAMGVTSLLFFSYTILVYYSFLYYEFQTSALKVGVGMSVLNVFL